MKMHALLVAVLSLAALSPASFAASKFKMMGAKDLATLMTDKSAPVAIYDVNNEDTRTKDGVIPGAKLLPSSSKYDVAKELPSAKDAKLVFYCANTRCMASHKAAERAAAAGYTDVNVMSDGIQGWVKSGQAAVPVSAVSGLSGH